MYILWKYLCHCKNWLVQRRMALTFLTVSIFIVYCLLDLYQPAEFSPGASADQSAKKVIFLTYMRSGSSFLGELSRRNPRHQYWFEPVDGVYSHLYTTSFGWYPLDITQLVNGTRRTLPQYERYSLVKSILGMLDCKFSDVPLEVLSGAAMFRQNYQNIQEYADCMKEQFKVNKQGTKKQDKKPLYSKLHQCKRDMRFICPRKFTGSVKDRLVMCYQQGHHQNHTTKPASPPTSTSNKHSDTWTDFFQKKSESKLKVEMTSYHEEFQGVFREELFRKHGECLAPFQRAVAVCVDRLYEKCESAGARVMKVIRLTMDTVHDLLQVDPTVKIVHLLRDPRGITHSRFGGLISGVAKFMSVSSDLNERHLMEAKLLCSKMRHDIKLRRRLQMRYKRSFLELKYEQFASEPVRTYEKVYDFLGLEASDAVLNWIKANAQSVRAKPKKFNTERKNSTETAFNWEKGVNYRLVKDINRECGDVLEYLGYEL